MKFLYYAKFYGTCGVNIYKIGVSSDVYKRVTNICPEGFDIKILYMENFHNNSDAFKAETIVKRACKNKKAKDSYYMPETETFDNDVLNLDIENSRDEKI